MINAARFAWEKGRFAAADLRVRLGARRVAVIATADRVAELVPLAGVGLLERTPGVRLDLVPAPTLVAVVGEEPGGEIACRGELRVGVDLLDLHVGPADGVADGLGPLVDVLADVHLFDPGGLLRD